MREDAKVLGQYKCLYCPSTFGQEAQVIIHEQRCERNPNREEYKCQYCERSFQTELGCKWHKKRCVINIAPEEN
jgi:aspartate carbamoyltransferase regulatory subunit